MNGEGVDLNPAAAVIANGSFPVVERWATSTRDQILCDSSLRDSDTELEQLALKTGQNLLQGLRQGAVLRSTLLQVI